jgi:hypothetical protein
MEKFVMRRILLTSAALALAAAPAFAATNTPAGPDMNQSATGSGSGAQMGGQTSGPHGAALRQQINQDLSQAGFTDIHVMPESFLVRAKDKRGNPVMMVINPDSVTAVTEMSGQNGGQTAQNGGGAMGSSTMTNSGQSGGAINAPNGNGTTTR